MARAMVTRFGMSDELGPLAYAENQEEVFLGHTVARTQNMSEATAQKIDQEIRTHHRQVLSAARSEILHARASTICTRWPKACSNTRR